MKKTLVIIAIAGIALASCKKDRTCTCTNTVISRTSTQPNYTYTPQPPTTTTNKYEKIKKNNIYAEACVSQEQTQTYNETYYNGQTTVNYVVTDVSKSECELK